MVNHEPLNAAAISLSDEVDERDLSFGSDTDRQLVGEVAHGVQPTSLEDKGRQLFVLQFPLVFASSVFVPVSTLPSWLQPIAEASPVTLTADAARTLALTGGVPDSLGGALAWIVGIVAVFVPLSVWRYRRMS